MLNGQFSGWRPERNRKTQKARKEHTRAGESNRPGRKTGPGTRQTTRTNAHNRTEEKHQEPGQKGKFPRDLSSDVSHLFSIGSWVVAQHVWLCQCLLRQVKEGVAFHCVGDSWLALCGTWPACAPADGELCGPRPGCGCTFLLFWPFQSLLRVGGCVAPGRKKVWPSAGVGTYPPRVSWGHHTTLATTSSLYVGRVEGHPVCGRLDLICFRRQADSESALLAVTRQGNVVQPRRPIVPLIDTMSCATNRSVELM